MAKFNLKHSAKEEDVTSYNKMLEDARKDTDVAEKNMNLSIDKKDNDVTIPFEKQLEASRTDETDIIAEKGMDGEKMYNDKRKDLDGTTISPINLVSIKEDKEHDDKYKKAESEQDLETKFWDKCLGVQTINKNKKIPKPIKDNQLQNNPERFNKMNKDIYKVKPEKMVIASLMDADALIFNIYAKSIKEGRKINSEERNILDRINNEKVSLLRDN